MIVSYAETVAAVLLAWAGGIALWVAIDALADEDATLETAAFALVGSMLIAGAVVLSVDAWT
jgi:hypothetical protein